MNATPKSIEELPCEKHGITVLLVDDQRIIGEAVRRFLSSEPDMAFHFCQEPSEALKKAVEVSPTVILQDLVMPDVDGLSMLKLFRENPKTKDVPVIVLSSEDNSKVKSNAFALGASDYLIKLPDRIELIARIRHHSSGYINLLERNEAFEALVKSQKALAISNRLEAIGQLSAGIAHEINTPIQYIGDNLSFLQSSFQSIDKFISEIQPLCAGEQEAKLRAAAQTLDLDYLREEAPKALKQSMEGIERIAEIVHALKEFSHPEVKEKSMVDINRALLNTVTVTRNEWKYVAEVKTCLEPGLRQVLCHPGEINQVFLNIIVNAGQAIAAVAKGERKGTIEVTTRNLGESQVEIRIKDDGPGIPDSIKDKLFTPFFTTKEVGKGTGQGLSLARSIVLHKQGGELFFESEEGKGACFVIRLPAGSQEESS